MEKQIDEKVAGAAAMGNAKRYKPIKKK